MNTITAYLVDDHGVLRSGLVNLLTAEPDIEVLGDTASGKEALAFLNSNPVDVVITDHSMPEMDGLTFIRAVRKARPDQKIIVLTMHDELHLYREMEREAINGYVLKKDPGSELAGAVRMVHGGERFLSPVIASALERPVEPENAELLTRREREILQLIVKEQTNREIAETLFISEFTVETHRKNIFRKTGASSLVGLVNFAHANGLRELE